MTLSALGVPLAEPGLRVVVSSATGVVRVEVRGSGGGSNAVELCPVAGPSTPAPPANGCLVADPARPVDVTLASGARGVLVRPSPTSNAAGGRLDEVRFTYVASDDSLTIVTPPLPPPPGAGECAGGQCQMSVRLTPTGPGTFTLDTDGKKGSVQLTVESDAADAGQSHTLSRVGGGGRLRISSTVDGRSELVLVVRNLGPAALPPLELALVWPSRR